MKLYQYRVFKIVVFAFLIILIDNVAGFILHKLYFGQRTGSLSSLTYCLKDCKEEILIFGSSEAQSNYDPRIIRDSMHINCFNAGQGGGHTLLLFKAQIMSVLNRYTPKIIVLDLGSFDALKYAKSSYDKLAILEPYYADFPELRSIILLRGNYERYKLLAKTYPFNSKIVSLIRFNTDFDKDRQWMFNGFIPIIGKVLDTTKISINSISNEPDVIDTNKVNALKYIIKQCKYKNIKLYFSISPKYHFILDHNSQVTESQKLLKSIIETEKITFFDFNNTRFFQNKPYLFADQSHLNNGGATVFTGLIIKYLKDDISKQN